MCDGLTGGLERGVLLIVMGSNQVTGAVKAMRLTEQRSGGGTESASMKMLVVDAEGTVCTVADMSASAVDRFDAIALGDMVEVTGRRERWATWGVSGFTVGPGDLDSGEVLVADDVALLAPMPEVAQERALARACSGAASAAAAVEVMREAMEAYCTAGGMPETAQEAVALAVGGGTGIDDWLSSEAEMIAQHLHLDSGTGLGL